MKPSPVAAAKSLMAMKPKSFLHYLFAEGALSFLAFLLSIFIYVSVFNLSLSTDLLNNTKFWFCISNTLIFIIIAAAFHGGGDRRTHNAAAQFPTQQNPEHNFKTSKPTQEQQQITPHTTEVPIIPAIKFHSTTSYERNKLEKVKKVGEKERKISMKRSKTMIRHEMSTKKEEKEKNELTEMTNEELNRRVEEFIERFNRQIRLQEIIRHETEE